MSDYISREAVLNKLEGLPVTLDAEAVQRCIEVVSNSISVNTIPVPWMHGYADACHANGNSLAGDAIDRMLNEWGRADIREEKDD